MRREITERAYRFALRLAVLKHDRAYRDMVEREVSRQLFRAGSSVAANLEEATAAQSKADFVAKMSIAKKEAVEVQFWLRLAGDAQLLQAAMVRPLHEEASGIARVVSTIARRARQSDARSPVEDEADRK